MFFDFRPFEQETAMKRNNENFIQSANILLIFWLHNLRLVLIECNDRAYWPHEETNTLEI